MDRNAVGSWRLVMNLLSLSARRAWIEIGMQHNVCRGFAVALRKESVDRNFIELLLWGAGAVALRKESVDRNYGCDR